MNAATGFSLPLKVAFVHRTFGILCWYMHWFAKGISVLVIAGGGVALVRSFVCFPLLFFFCFLVARRTILITWRLFVRFLAFGDLTQPPMMSGSTRTQSSKNVRRLHARVQRPPQVIFRTVFWKYQRPVELQARWSEVSILARLICAVCPRQQLPENGTALGLRI